MHKYQLVVSKTNQTMPERGISKINKSDFQDLYFEVRFFGYSHK